MSDKHVIHVWSDDPTDVARVSAVSGQVRRRVRVAGRVPEAPPKAVVMNLARILLTSDDLRLLAERIRVTTPGDGPGIQHDKRVAALQRQLLAAAAAMERDSDDEPRIVCELVVRSEK